jgi:hypothetical protein
MQYDVCMIANMKILTTLTQSMNDTLLRVLTKQRNNVPHIYVDVRSRCVTLCMSHKRDETNDVCNHDDNRTCDDVTMSRNISRDVQSRVSTFA